MNLDNVGMEEVEKGDQHFLDEPYNVVLPMLSVEDDDDEYGIVLCCGYSHNLLITNRNRVYSWGFNKYRQCTVIHSDESVISPHLIDKQKEIGIDITDYIHKIIALPAESIIVIDPSVKVKSFS